MRVTSGCHGNVYETVRHLGGSAVKCGKMLPTFQTYLLLDLKGRGRKGGEKCTLRCLIIGPRL
jgi:hypothetical protein